MAHNKVGANTPRYFLDNCCLVLFLSLCNGHLIFSTKWKILSFLNSILVILIALYSNLLKFEHWFLSSIVSSLPFELCHLQIWQMYALHLQMCICYTILKFWKSWVIFDLAVSLLETCICIASHICIRGYAESYPMQHCYKEKWE